MSNVIDAIPEVIDPVVIDGQVDDNGEAAIEPLTEEQDIFDTSEHNERFVRLQVDGEIITVPLKEALAGYQRQASYTRNSQALSDQRKSVEFAVTLQEALQNDTANTLRLLNQQYGQSIQPEVLVEDEWLDPQEKQLKELSARLTSFENQKATDDLTKTIDSLVSKYGEDFNADDVVFKAMQQGSTDLEAVFKQIAFDKIYSASQTTKKKLVDEQARLDAKRGANIVSSSSTSKGISAPQSTHAKTVLEAFEQATRSLEGG